MTGNNLHTPELRPIRRKDPHRALESHFMNDRMNQSNLAGNLAFISSRIHGSMPAGSSDFPCNQAFRTRGNSKAKNLGVGIPVTASLDALLSHCPARGRDQTRG